MHQPSNRSLPKPGCGAGTTRARVPRYDAEKSTALLDCALSHLRGHALSRLRRPPEASQQTDDSNAQAVAQQLSLHRCHWRPSQLRHSQPNHPLRSCDSICLASPLTDCRNSTVSAGALRRSARFCKARSRVARSTASKFVSNDSADLGISTLLV